MPGKSGNPKGRPSTRGLLNALKAAVSEVAKDGETNEQKLVDVLMYEALKGRKRLAAVTTIFDRLEGKPVQPYEDQSKSVENRPAEDLAYWLLHKHFPEETCECPDKIKLSKPPQVGGTA